MDLAYHRKCINDAYSIASFAEAHHRVLDRNTIKVLAGFMREAVAHEEYRSGPGLARIRELGAILQDHYAAQRRDPTISGAFH